MEFGPEIAADNGGTKLPWLDDEDEVMCYWSPETHSGPYLVHYVKGWNADFRIRLPADHPYYLATSKGFQYWPGGDVAPGDWDGGAVLLRHGVEGMGINWSRDQYGRGEEQTDIIGYRRAEQAEELAQRYYNNDLPLQDQLFAEFQKLGLIKPAPTPLEAFEQGRGPLPIAERALLVEFEKWSAGR